jgi:hypothetical protein
VRAPRARACAEYPHLRFSHAQVATGETTDGKGIFLHRRIRSLNSTPEFPFSQREEIGYLTPAQTSCLNANQPGPFKMEFKPRAPKNSAMYMYYLNYGSSTKQVPNPTPWPTHAAHSLVGKSGVGSSGQARVSNETSTSVRSTRDQTRSVLHGRINPSRHCAQHSS